MNQVLRQSNCDPDDEEEMDIWDHEDEDTDYNGEDEEYNDDDYDYWTITQLITNVYIRFNWGGAKCVQQMVVCVIQR